MNTFDEDTVSEMHKKARGNKPNASWWRAWDKADATEKSNLANVLCNEIETRLTSPVFDDSMMFAAL